MNTENLEKQARDFLVKPYTRVIIPEAGSGGYSAAILEFPGCYSQGDTAQEAYENLDRAAESWPIAVMGLNQEVPLPDGTHHFNRFNKIPDGSADDFGNTEKAKS